MQEDHKTRGLSEFSAIRRIRPLLALYPWATPLLILLGFLNSLVEGVGIALLIPLLGPEGGGPRLGWLYGLIVRPFAGLTPSHRALVVALAILGAICLKAVLASLYGIICYWLINATTHELRCRVFSQLMRLGPSYLDTNQSARAIDLAVSATDSSGLAVAFFVWLLINLCNILMFTIMLLLLSFSLTCMVGLSMIVISWLSRLLTRRIEPLAQIYRQASIDLKNRIVESVFGIATVWTFVGERKEETRYAEVSFRVRRVLYEMRRLAALTDPLIEGLSVAVLLALMLFAMLGKMPLALLLTFIFMLYRLQPQMKSFEQNRISLVEYSVAATEILKFLDPQDKTYVRSGERSFSELVSGIELRAVTFAYPTRSTPAVRDVSLTIPKGKLTALVGPSGAGKSTLVHLLCRFYDVTAGEILVDGIPLHTLDLVSWRSRLSVVSQDPFLFAATIRDNIAYGRSGATEAEIMDAARQAHAHEFILSLPQGYDTLVGDRGVRLSGGQRQRIAIARAFLCDAKILIFDEATSELDGLSEELIRETIRSLRSHRTVLAIAHRLSTIEEADQIIVLEDGMAVEQGYLNELLKNDGLFASLYRAQRSPPRSEPGNIVM